MLGILLIAIAASVVYKAAEMENRNGTGWAALSVLMSLVWGLFLPFGFAVGLFAPLAIMFIVNVVKGPTIG